MWLTGPKVKTGCCGENREYPRQDLNLCTRLRRPALYPPELRGQIFSLR
jgi:hypothetical protein